MQAGAGCKTAETGRFPGGGRPLRLVSMTTPGRQHCGILPRGSGLLPEVTRSPAELGRGAEVPSLLPPPGASRSVPGFGKPRSSAKSVYLQAATGQPPWRSYCASCSCTGLRVSGASFCPQSLALAARGLPGTMGRGGRGWLNLGRCCGGGGWAPMHQGDLARPRAPAGRMHLYQESRRGRGAAGRQRSWDQISR